MTTGAIRIGVDLGGTKIEAIALGADGKVLASRRVATPAHDYAAITRAVADLTRALEIEAGGRASVGIGMPGAISPKTGLVKNSNTVALNGRPFDRDIAAALEGPRGSRTTPIVSRYRKPWTAPAPALAWCSASYSHRRRRRTRRGRRSDVRTQRNRRRMGP